MPDFTMCTAQNCARSASCRRHEDSGTRPSDHRQSYSNFATGKWFDPYRCTAFWVKPKAPEDQDE